MSRYLVTGSAGFIGSRVAQRLLSQSHTVIGVDNFNDAYDPRLKTWRHCLLKDQNGFEFHRLDVCDKKSLDRVFQQGIDGVLNLAARAGVRQSVENPAAYFDTNVSGTLILLELCKEHGVGKFVLASTSRTIHLVSPSGSPRHQQCRGHPPQTQHNLCWPLQSGCLHIHLATTDLPGSRHGRTPNLSGCSTRLTRYQVQSRG